MLFQQGSWWSARPCRERSVESGADRTSLEIVITLKFSIISTAFGIYLYVFSENFKFISQKI
jgi:hypothetical protein